MSLYRTLQDARSEEDVKDALLHDTLIVAIHFCPARYSP